MKPFYVKTYIVSVYNAQNCEAINLKAHENAQKYLTNKGFKIKEVSGLFDGIHETALVVLGALDSEITQFLKDFDQKCALKLDGFRNAYFLFPNGNEQYGGQFKGTSEQDIIKGKDYTFDPDTGTYYYLEK